jgi:hypothetical protein
MMASQKIGTSYGAVVAKPITAKKKECQKSKLTKGRT